MTRFVSLFLLLIFAFSAPALAQTSCAYHPSHSFAGLKRGINLSRWWQADRQYVLDEDETVGLRAAGFNFIRLPLSPSWLEIEDADEQKERLEALRCDLVMLLNSGLSVVLDLHAPESFKRQDPEELLPRLQAVWQKLQLALAGLPPQQVFLELYNEPRLTATTWWVLQGKLIKALRPVYPRHTFIASAGPDNGAWALSQMKPYGDKNVIYDIHFYTPMFLTHHGAEWRPDYDRREKFDQIVYPASKKFATPDDSDKMQNYVAGDWNHQRLAASLKKLRAWKKRYGARVACLEFGVYALYVDPQSRDHWLHDVRMILEEAGIPWALWEYRGGFGLADADGGLDEGMVKALDLRNNHTP
ncbi:MAG: cellulase family glycosylhydrolase [Proteobacteria bacterium]|nr:cellulase family glycosylhydrolase [Pseudomonadota bacterium]